MRRPPLGGKPSDYDPALEAELTDDERVVLAEWCRLCGLGARGWATAPLRRLVESVTVQRLAEKYGEAMSWEKALREAAWSLGVSDETHARLLRRWRNGKRDAA